MEEHLALIKEMGLPVPESNPESTILIRNEKLWHQLRNSVLQHVRTNSSRDVRNNEDDFQY